VTFLVILRNVKFSTANIAKINHAIIKLVMMKKVRNVYAVIQTKRECF